MIFPLTLVHNYPIVGLSTQTQKGNEMATRTDTHSPSNLILDDYTPVFFFCAASMDSGFPTPPINIDKLRALQSAGQLAQIHGGFFACDICGARYKHGECWRHDPTGEHITLGHTCAEKYGFAAENDFVSAYDKLRAIEVDRAIRNGKRAAAFETMVSFLRSMPRPKALTFLRTLRTPNSDFFSSIRAQLREKGELSDRQTEAVFNSAAKMEASRKLREMMDSREIGEAIDVPDHDERVRISGQILTVKTVDGFAYGTFVDKILLRVETPEGHFKLWGTLPSKLMSADRGDVIAFTARMERSEKDSGFGFYKRPTKCEIVEKLSGN